MIRVASFNIRNGRAFDGWNSWPFRRRATAGAIASLDADLVGLQEVFGFQRRWLSKRLDGYEVVSAGRQGGQRGESCPVFALRSAGAIEDFATRWYGAAPDQPGSRLEGAHFPRIVTSCRFLTVSGGHLTFLNTHLDSASADGRRASVVQLAEWVSGPAAEGPTIVVGDFNAGPHDPLFELLTEVGLRSALPPEAGGTNHRFTGTAEGRRLDHILVSRHFEVVKGWVSYLRPRGRLPSDHWPVAADLRLHGTDPH